MINISSYLFHRHKEFQLAKARDTHNYRQKTNTIRGENKQYDELIKEVNKQRMRARRAKDPDIKAKAREKAHEAGRQASAIRRGIENWLSSFTYW